MFRIDARSQGYERNCHLVLNASSRLPPGVRILDYRHNTSFNRIFTEVADKTF